MKKSRTFSMVMVLVIAMLAFGVAQVSATADKSVGEQISLFAAPATFDVGEPFHVQHGWGLTPLTDIPGRTAFRLELDGVMLGKPDYTMFVHVKDLPIDLVRHWGYNFPDGLSAGEHSLVGHWYWPCVAAIEDGYYPGSCATPNALVEVLTLDTVIEFQ